jgi:hypothetical protein
VLQIGETCLGILAVFMAVNQGIKDSHFVRQALPRLRIPGWINYVPLLLFVIGAGFLVYQRQPFVRPAPSQASAAAKPIPPAVKPAPPIVRLVPPPVLKGSVTLAWVRQVLESQSPANAEITLGRYLGTPMRVSGEVLDIEQQRGGNMHLVSMTSGKYRPRISLLFDSDGGIGYYSKGDHLVAECRIERLDVTGMGLDGCRAIDGEAWTTPAPR